MADTLAAILLEQARAGVKVSVLYDTFGCDLPESYFELLRSAGVKAVAFRPLRFKNLWVIQNRSHVRGIVVDRRLGWTEATGELLTGRMTLDRHEDGVAMAGLLYTAPTLGSTPAERYLALSIGGARERLYITNAYLPPTKTLLRSLLKPPGEAWTCVSS